MMMTTANDTNSRTISERKRGKMRRVVTCFLLIFFSFLLVFSVCLFLACGSSLVCDQVIAVAESNANTPKSTKQTNKHIGCRCRSRCVAYWIALSSKSDHKCANDDDNNKDIAPKQQAANKWIAPKSLFFVQQKLLTWIRSMVDRVCAAFNWCWPPKANVPSVHLKRFVSFMSRPFCHPVLSVRRILSCYLGQNEQAIDLPAVGHDANGQVDGMPTFGQGVTLKDSFWDWKFKGKLWFCFLFLGHLIEFHRRFRSKPPRIDRCFALWWVVLMNF